MRSRRFAVCTLWSRLGRRSTVDDLTCFVLTTDDIWVCLFANLVNVICKTAGRFRADCDTIGKIRCIRARLIDHRRIFWVQYVTGIIFVALDAGRAGYGCVKATRSWLAHNLTKCLMVSIGNSRVVIQASVEDLLHGIVSGCCCRCMWCSCC